MSNNPPPIRSSLFATPNGVNGWTEVVLSADASTCGPCCAPAHELCRLQQMTCNQEQLEGFSEALGFELDQTSLDGAFTVTSVSGRS
jgi:hypothetical protein